MAGNNDTECREKNETTYEDGLRAGAAGGTATYVSTRRLVAVKTAARCDKTPPRV